MQFQWGEYIVGNVVDVSIHVFFDPRQQQLKISALFSFRCHNGNRIVFSVVRCRSNTKKYYVIIWWESSFFAVCHISLPFLIFPSYNETLLRFFHTEIIMTLIWYTTIGQWLKMTFHCVFFFLRKSICMKTDKSRFGFGCSCTDRC